MAIINVIETEIADNWPAFVYIAMMVAFSVCFFRDRRAEMQLVRHIGETIQEDIRARFDRLEMLVENSTTKDPKFTRIAG
jgi:hypothetical protein